MSLPKIDIHIYLLNGFADADFFQGAAYIVSSYAQKLRNEQTWRSGPQVVAIPMNNNSGPKYTHVKQEDETQPFTSTSYAYGDANHSFGNSHV